MILLDGKKTSNDIKDEIALEVDSLINSSGKKPHLAAILVGNNGASETYVNAKVKACNKVGFDSTLVRLDDSVSENKLIDEINKINNNDLIDGLIVQLPLPNHINEKKIINTIDVLKDVDGFHPINIGNMTLNLPSFIPATPAGIIELLDRYKIDTEGKNCVVIGRSHIVGLPISILMARNNNPGNATVTLVHSRSKNIEEICLRADILIVALGKANFVNSSMVKDGCCIIDVGITRIPSDVTKSGWKLVGDVDFNDVKTVMTDGGVAIMGTATSEGEDRAKLAVDEALNSPLLEENDIQGAQHILLNITSGNKEVTMDEIFEITEFVQEEAGFGTDLIWGNCYDESLGDQLSVTVIATGFEESQPTATKTGNAKIKIPLDSSDNTKKKNGIFEIGYDNGQSANTVEFDNVRSNYEQYQRQMGYSYEEPYVKSEDKERIKEERRKRLEFEALKREERLRNLSVKLNNPQTVNELENEPAYLRRKVNLDDVPHSNEVSNLSRLSITDDVEPEIRKENSYLHDRPD